MKNTTNLETVLDGVRFCGQVAHEEHPELGPLFGEDALRVFDAKIVQSIASRGLYGPEMFRFVRKFARIGIGEAASLLRADRKTVPLGIGGDDPSPCRDGGIRGDRGRAKARQVRHVRASEGTVRTKAGIRQRRRRGVNSCLCSRLKGRGCGV